MAGRSAWKAQVLERVVEAAGHFDSARWWLADQAARLALPMRVDDDARSVRRRIQLVHDTLTGVSTELAVAVSVVAAAELIALRGAAAISPMDPLALPSIHSLLRSALAFAEDAYGSLERCLGHLHAAFCLLTNYDPADLLPGAADGFVEAERVAALRALEDALAAAVESEMLVITARPHVR